MSRPARSLACSADRSFPDDARGPAALGASGVKLGASGVKTASRSALPALALLLLVCACAPAGSSRLQGRWRGVRAEGVPGEASRSADAFALHTQLRVEGSEMAVVSPHLAQVGRYRVVREDSTTLVLATDVDGPAMPETFTFGADGTMRWAVAPGKAIVFARE